MEDGELIENAEYEAKNEQAFVEGASRTGFAAGDRAHHCEAK